MFWTIFLFIVLGILTVLFFGAAGLSAKDAVKARENEDKDEYSKLSAAFVIGVLVGCLSLAGVITIVVGWVS